jgi:hypothetical protein
VLLVKAIKRAVMSDKWRVASGKSESKGQWRVTSGERGDQSNEAKRARQNGGEHALPVMLSAAKHPARNDGLKEQILRPDAIGTQDDNDRWRMTDGAKS